MTIEAAGTYLYLRCGSGDGTVVEFDADPEANGDDLRINVFAEPTYAADAETPSATLMVSPAEAIMLGEWLVRMGEARMRQAAP